MRIVFLGTPELAVPTLAAVAERHEVAAIVCQPDRPKGRSNKPVPCPTKSWGLEHDVPVVQPTALNDGAFETWLRVQAPDVCVLVAYGRILKQPILDAPKHGFLNMHPSLLPRHRGPSPIHTAILSGDEVTGVTIMRLDAGMDTGDILLQKESPILPDDTTASLSERLAGAGAAAMLRGIEQIETGRAVFRPQECEGATVTRLFEKQDGQIRWGAGAREIHNLVRASIPWPVAHCMFHGAVTRICRTQVLTVCRGLTNCDEPAEAPPGAVTRVERDRVIVATGKGQLAVLEIQTPGKRVMSVGEFLRGHAITAGDRFEDIS